MNGDATTTLKDAAARAGVTPETLRRWVGDGVIPHSVSDGWTAAAVAHARIVARLRERGHSLAEIREADARRQAGLRRTSRTCCRPPAHGYTLERGRAARPASSRR